MTPGKTKLVQKQINLLILNVVYFVNTKKWYRKEADLWAELGDEIPFG
jgi:hypothetical protein